MYFHIWLFILLKIDETLSFILYYNCKLPITIFQCRGVYKYTSKILSQNIQSRFMKLGFGLSLASSWQRSCWSWLKLKFCLWIEKCRAKEPSYLGWSYFPIVKTLVEGGSRDTRQIIRITDIPSWYYKCQAAGIKLVFYSSWKSHKKLF